MPYDIVTLKELTEITNEKVLKEANTECMLRCKVQIIAKGLVEHREGYGIERVVELLGRLSRSREAGVEVSGLEEDKMLRLRYGTSDYMYYTIFLGMLQNHPLISRRLEEFQSIKEGQGEGKVVIRQQAGKHGGLGVIRLEGGRILVFLANSVVGEVSSKDSNVLKWHKVVSSKYISQVAKLLKALGEPQGQQGAEIEGDIIDTVSNNNDENKEELPWT